MPMTTTATYAIQQLPLPLSMRIREWARRYLPAEIVSLVATIAAAQLVRRAGGSDVGLALAASWSGNLVYFGWILAQDVIKTRRKLHERRRVYTRKSFARNLKALFVEFGIAEALDSFVIRPVLMFALPRWIGDVTWGVVVGKLLADVAFYVPAIVGYEMSRHLRQPAPTATDHPVVRLDDE